MEIAKGYSHLAVTTEDGHIAVIHEKVFEIMWQYFNDEYSRAYERATTAADVPKGTRVWKSQYEARKVCRELNKQRAEELEKLVNRWT